MAEIPPPPAWNSEEFAATIHAIQAGFNCSEEEAINRMQLMWNPPNNRQRSATPPPPPTPPLPPPPAPRQDSQVRDVNTPPPQEKTKFTDFDPNASIEDRVLPTPSKFALDKVKRMEYVELWYFTSEGIAEVSKVTLTAADDCYGLLMTETGAVAFQQIKAMKAGRNVISDENLTWDQIMTARIHLYAATVGWPEKHRTSLTGLFMSLENLKARNSTTNFTRALIRYQATARKRWHATLQDGLGTFNVSLVNFTLLANIEGEVRDKKHDNLQKQASMVFLIPNAPPTDQCSLLAFFPMTVFCYATLCCTSPPMLRICTNPPPPCYAPFTTTIALVRSSLA